MIEWRDEQLSVGSKMAGEKEERNDDHIYLVEWVPREAARRENHC